MSSQKGNSFLANIKQTNLQNFFMVFQESTFPFNLFFTDSICSKFLKNFMEW